MAANVRIHDLPAHERPREMLVEKGADSLSEAHLIAILLRTGMKGKSAIDIASQLISKFGTLENLARASLDDLQIKGVGRDKAVTLKAAFTLARKMAKQIQREAPLLDTPDQIAEMFREENRLRTVETFQAILLNTRRRFMGARDI